MSPLELNSRLSIEQMSSMVSNKKVAPENKSEVKTSFAEVLNDVTYGNQTEALRFSKHVNERMQQRDINLSENQYKRLDDAVKKAHSKGIRESLVMLDDYAFIVNVDKSLVITAVTGDEERIFSNIDGAVIV